MIHTVSFLCSLEAKEIYDIAHRTQPKPDQQNALDTKCYTGDVHVDNGNKIAQDYFN